MFKMKRCDLKLLERDHYEAFRSFQTNLQVTKYLGGVSSHLEILKKFEAKLNSDDSLSWIVTEQSSGFLLAL